MKINSDLIIGDTGKTLKDVCQDEVYSTNEVKTNKVYIDQNGVKHSIYRKMYVGKAGSTARSWVTIAGVPSGYTKFIKFEGQITNEDGAKMPLFFLIATPGGDPYYFEARIDRYLQIQYAQSGYVGVDYEIVLEYLKD